MRAGLLRWGRRLAAALLLAAVAAGGVLAWRHVAGPLIELHNLPERYARRSGAFAASVAGSVSRLGHDLEWRLNDGAWQPVRWTAERTAWPDFVIDLPTEGLQAGANVLELRAEGWLHRGETLSRRFGYDPEPPRLPLTVDWYGVASPDAQDGPWETFLDGAGGARVRPIPEHEGVERVLAVTGAFGGGRRVVTDVVMRRPVGIWPLGTQLLPRRDYAFGIMPLWGGHPDAAGREVGRGRRHAYAYWTAKDYGLGTGFVERTGPSPTRWISAGQSLPLKWGATYRIVAEAWPVRGEGDRHLGWRQRVKMWRADQPEPGGWLAVDDLADPILPDGEYGVALVAHRTAADFGPVTVQAIEVPPEDDIALTRQADQGFYPVGASQIGLDAASLTGG